jgi:hypothetical protein
MVLLEITFSMPRRRVPRYEGMYHAFRHPPNVTLNVASFTFGIVNYIISTRQVELAGAIGKG